MLCLSSHSIGRVIAPWLSPAGALRLPEVVSPLPVWTERGTGWACIGNWPYIAGWRFNLGYHRSRFAALAATDATTTTRLRPAANNCFPMFDRLPRAYVHALGPTTSTTAFALPMKTPRLRAGRSRRSSRAKTETRSLGSCLSRCSGTTSTSPIRTYYRLVTEICDANDVLMISYETITGFGRVGKWWGMSHYPESELDLTSFGEGVIRGSVPPSRAIASERVWDGIRCYSPKRSVEITGTHGGHPVLLRRRPTQPRALSRRSCGSGSDT
jgi:adenosylmethionine-8-amino-7-oxononanoate aminotransferase